MLIPTFWSLLSPLSELSEEIARINATPPPGTTPSSTAAAWLKQYNKTSITIEGHCDERGTREYNLALGERRAQAVKNYLNGLGVSTSSMSTISYGKERPAVVGSNDDAWGQNRRSVTKVN